MDLATINNHPRDAHISFDEPTHIYTIDGDNSYKSVTTFIHDFFPHFNADQIIQKMTKSPNWKSSPYYGKNSQEIKELWEKNRDEAATLGTMMHANIEDYYNGIPLKEEFKNCGEGKHFLNYLKDHENFKAFRTEWMVYSKKYKIAGSIDMVYIDPDNPEQVIIADWKRSKEIKRENSWEKGLGPLAHLDNCNFWHYTLQLNIYRMIIEKYYDKKVSYMFLVVLHPSNDNYIKIDIPKISKEIMDMLEYRKLAILNS